MQKLKIVVSGSFNAGKTQFIKTASDVPVITTERRVTDFTAAIKPLTTTALDFGIIKMSDQLALHLYGTPGQPRFDFMWSALAKGMRGLVIVVDSSDADDLRLTRYIINYFAAICNVPVVVAANKQDIPGAYTPEWLHKALRLPNDTPVVPCIATDLQSVRITLTTLATYLSPALSSEAGEKSTALSSQIL